MKAGDWVNVPKGTMVCDDAAGTEHERRVSYKVELVHVENGRGIWRGNQARLFSADLADLDYLPEGHVRGGQRGQRRVRDKSKPRGPRVVRCPHGFIPPLCLLCHRKANEDEWKKS